MNKPAPFRWILAAALTLSVAAMGCAGPPVAPDPGPVALDEWLETEAFEAITAQLKDNTFLKQRPFLIVKSDGQQVSDRIDRLTEDVREVMLPRLRAHSQIRSVFRHPVSGIDRPYRLQELHCGNYQDISLLLAIDIKPTGSPGDHLARISIGAIDIDKGAWVEGFSLYRSEVRLTSRQRRQLETTRPDEYLRGLRYLPFEGTQQDEMAAYLARNLSCIFKDAYGGPGRNVFVATAEFAGTDVAAVSRLMEKQLNFSNEIQLVNSPDRADWIVVAEALETGAGTGLYQYWVDVSRREDGQLVKGLATHAYFSAGGPRADGIAGTWELRDATSGRIIGRLRIRSGAAGRYSGDLFAADGHARRQAGIDIAVAGSDVSWIYYAQEEQKTYEVNGVLRADGKTMALTRSAVPAFDAPRSLELIRLD